MAILVVEYPTNWIIQRVPIAKYLSCNIMAWGTVLAFHAMAKNFTSLIICRILLGIFEAACQPSFVVLSSMWYKREEQMARVTYWYMMNVSTSYFFHPADLAGLFNKADELVLIREPGCPTSCRRSPRLLLHSNRCRQGHQVIPSPFHHLWCCLRLLGYLCALVDARFPYARQVLH
jgi:hypothetical protein